jgi:hypothetical protein
VIRPKEEGFMSKADSTHKPHANLPPGVERRTTPRFDCDRGVQCWKDGSHVSIWGTFVDLSVTGCSISLPTPLPPGARLTMVFNLFGSSIRVSGVVRTLKDAVMGVAFAAMPEAEQSKLCTVVQRLADGRNTGSAAVLNTQAAIQRLQRWFQKHDLLTRELFQRLVDGSFDPALGSSVSPLMDKVSAGFSMEKAAADPSHR